MRVNRELDEVNKLIKIQQRQIKSSVKQLKAKQTFLNTVTAKNDVLSVLKSEKNSEKLVVND